MLKSDFLFKVFRHMLRLHKCVVRQASTVRTARRSWGSRQQHDARVHRHPGTTAAHSCRFSRDGVRTRGLTYHHVMQVNHDMTFARWFKVDRYYLIRLIITYETETLPENLSFIRANVHGCIYKCQWFDQNFLLIASSCYSHQFSLIEKGKRMCEQYWPDEKSGEITFHSSTQSVSVRKLAEKRIGQIICRSLCILPKSKTKVCIFLSQMVIRLSE